MPLISALGSQTQADLCVYRVRFRAARDIQRYPVSGKKRKEKKKQKKSEVL